MRSLLGRLNSRSPEELGRIAVAWQVHVTATDKITQVTQIYKAMADPTGVRDIWERLSADERALISTLVRGGDSSLDIPSLATRLELPEDEVRTIAARLYHKGIVARERDDDPLPVGELPKLFLSREIGHGFRRTLDEIAAGASGGKALVDLLATLDDNELESAADLWGVRIVPGLRPREDVARLILQHVAEPQRRDAVIARLRGDAARLWRQFSGDPGPAPTPISAVMEAAGLLGGDIAMAQRRRQALGDLEAALLVWHLYLPEERRALFIPAEIREPGMAPIADRPLPPPVAQPAVGGATRHPHALAWDLLTLLRAVATPVGVAVGDLEDAPPSWLRSLNPSLWNRGPDLPPPGYIEFLGDLARSEDLLTGGDPAIGQALTLGGSMRAWRDRTFWEQNSRLRAAWFSASSWIEGSNRQEVDVWGADWTGLRIKLLSHLSALQPDAWYGLDAITAWLAARDPDLLGTTFTVATARNTDVANDEAATRRAAVAEVASVSLETAFAWFGLVEIANAPRQPRALRLTPIGVALAKAQPLPDDAPAPGAVAELADDAMVRLLAPTPLRVWSLSAFAEVRELGAVSVYGLTQESVARALAAGFEVRQIVAFLTRQLGLEMPPPLERRLEGWSRGVRRVRVQRSLTLTPDDADQRAELELACRSAKLSTRIEGGDLLVDIDDDDDEAAVWEGLRAGGFAPQWAKDGRSPSPSSG